MRGGAAAIQEDLRTALRAAGDPQRAQHQQAYMRSALPYAGVAMPTLRRIQRAVLADVSVDSFDSWRATVLELWSQAEVREEWYVAIAMARHRRFADWAGRTAALPLYRELIESGAWWDVVDEIAQHLVGGVLAGNPEQTANTLRGWASADSLWLHGRPSSRRTGIRKPTGRCWWT